jgi:V/A-type H+-transporting ATPase subunit C
MQARFLKHKDYADFSALKTVEEVGGRINGLAGYANTLRAPGGEALSRHSIERNLLRSLFGDYERIHKFSADIDFRNYLDAFFMDNEIRVIKMLLGMVLDERTDEFSPEEFGGQMGGKYMPDTNRLAKSRNMGEFIENLSGTRYYNPLIRIYNSETTVFQFEMQLDLFYYLNLWRHTKMLKGKERAAVEGIIGTQIDLRNIMWVYRFKKYYSLKPEEIYSFLIPIHYKLKARDLTALVHQGGAWNQEALVEGVIPYYKNVFSEDMTLEFCYYKKMSRVYQKARKENKSSVISAIAYIFLKELEINNLTTLTEGVRYELTPSDIMKHIYYPEDRLV